MWKKFREMVACFISPEYKEEADRVLVKALFERQHITEEVNRRVAEFTAHLDPVDLLMRDYNGLFSNDFSHPEDRLNEPAKIGMYMWAWTQKKDPYFNHMVEFIMDSAGNATMKDKIPFTDEKLFRLKMLYGRAQIANMILFKEEIGRLSSNYEEMLNKNKGESFDAHKGVED